jgi:hypothetical protein
MLAADPEQSSVPYSHMTNKGNAVKKTRKNDKPRIRHRGCLMAKPGEQLTSMEIKVLN